MLARLEAMEYNKLKNTLIIGWNIEAAGLYDKIITSPALGYNIRGFVNPSGVREKSHYKNVPVIGDLSNFGDTLQRLEISDALIILSASEKKYLSEIIKECVKYGIEYKIVSDTYDSEYGRVIRDVIKDAWNPQDFGLRRIIDIFASLILMILLLPLFLIIAIVIKYESSGPVFYSQQRYGKNGRIFAVHKFRSMVQDAEKKSGPMWAQKKDPRITKTGAFIRKTRIDELPQLLNVLKGDMSIIGPRPERPFFADSFKTKIPMYINRLKVKPGITGLAQVMVGYDETMEDVKEKVEKDIDYIDNSSKWRMNFKVLWKTIFVVLLGEGQ